jgi:PIN domain nuclease of toxin-antitoxin system
VSKKARKSIAEEDCHVSMASFWEIAVKVSLGKLRLPSTFSRYLPEQMSANGFLSLDIGFRHIAGCAALPWKHRDPFDRVLISQAIEEGMAVVSRDEVFSAYGVHRIW